ncbi:energy transducer TonB [Acidobacteriota bacterium]
MRRIAIVFTFILAASAAHTLPVQDEALLTGYTLMLGYPENGHYDDGITLILPGTVIPSLEGEKWSHDITTMRQQLKDAYRLEKIETRTIYRKQMILGEPTEMPAPDDWIIRMTLVGFNETIATYRAEIEIKGQYVANAAASVKLGGRAVIGSRVKDADFDDPYVFIVVEARKYQNVLTYDDAVSKPKIIEAIHPKYPEECKKKGIEGIVVVETIVSKDGSCEVKEVVKSPHKLMSDSAVESVNKWRFDPARDEQGNPLNVVMKLSVQFRLTKDEKK